MGRQCKFCKKSAILNPYLSFHRFPSDMERRVKWSTALGIGLPQTQPFAYVCSDHFDEKYFNVREVRGGSGEILLRRQLKATAIPKLYESAVEERFPKNPEKREVWFSILGMEDLENFPKYAEICSEHFNPSDIITKPNGNRCLKADAVPDLNAPIFPDDRSSSSSDSTASVSSPPPWSPPRTSGVSFKEQSEEEINPFSSSTTLSASETEKVQRLATKGAFEGTEEMYSSSSIVTSEGLYKNNKLKPLKKRFPQDPEKRKHWLSLVGIFEGQPLPRNNLMKKWLCSDHFYPEDLLVRSNGARFIRKDANPRRCEGVIFLDDASNSSDSESTGTSSPPRKNNVQLSMEADYRRGSKSKLRLSTRRKKGSNILKYNSARRVGLPCLTKDIIDSSESVTCLQWVKNCGRYDLLQKTPSQMHKSYKVCSKHFEEIMFSGMSKSRLKKTAVPTIFPSWPDGTASTSTFKENSVSLCKTMNPEVGLDATLMENPQVIDVDSPDSPDKYDDINDNADLRGDDPMPEVKVEEDSAIIIDSDTDTAEAGDEKEEADNTTKTVSQTDYSQIRPFLMPIEEGTTTVSAEVIDDDDSDISSLRKNEEPKRSRSRTEDKVNSKRKKEASSSNDKKLYHAANAKVKIVKVVRYYYKKTCLDVHPNEENTIIIYQKKFENIHVALYKNHEYLLSPDQNKWRCNKSQNCPALLTIDKARSTKRIYEISQHNCLEPMEVLNGTKFETYTFVNIVYYRGFSIPGVKSGALSSLGKDTMVLCRTEKRHRTIEAFYNGYTYVISDIDEEDYLEYGCSSTGCEGSLNVSRAGIDMKRVLERGHHTCGQTQCCTETTSTSTEIAPEGFTAVKAIEYNSYEEFAFFLKISRFGHSSTVPLIYVNTNAVYYRGYEYSRSVVKKPDASTVYNYFKCSTEYCAARLQATYLGFTAVSEISRHTCNGNADKRTVHRYRLIKISNVDELMDIRATKVLQANNAKKSAPKSKYVKVKFVHLKDENAPDLDLIDADILRIYKDESQKSLYCYKGYKYKYDTGRKVYACIKEECTASLILRKQSSQLMEMGEHTCEHTISRITKLRKYRITNRPDKKGTSPVRTNNNSTDNEVRDSAEVGSETVNVVRYHSKKKEDIADPNDENILIIYPKRFENIRVGLFRKHEYLMLSDRHTMRCNKSQNCPALIVFGRAPNNKVYQVALHNCQEPIGVLNGNEFKLYALVNVVYYQGTTIPGLDSGLPLLSRSTMVLCQSDKHGAPEAFYNGYKYVTSIITKSYLQYVCSFANCKGSLRISQAGIDLKKVLELDCHSCEQRQSRALGQVAPEGFTAVKPIRYNSGGELAFLLKIHPNNSDVPLIYVNKKEVYYKDYEYFKPLVEEPTASANSFFKCITESCSAQLETTADFTAVSERSKHTCNVEPEKRTVHPYNLVKLSQITEDNRMWTSALQENLDTDPSVSKSDFIKVKYVYSKNNQPMRISDLAPNDTKTLRIYMDTNKKYLYYYKGYTYMDGASTQLCLCSKKKCAAALILRKGSSELRELGQHTCTSLSMKRAKKIKKPNIVAAPDKTSTSSLSTISTPIDKEPLKQTLQIPCPPLRPILPRKTGTELTKVNDSLNYTSGVKVKKCLDSDLNMAELDPNDATKTYVYQDEAGRSIIYYKGHTYHKNHVIYLCSKSRGCSAALMPNSDSGFLKFDEVGEHNCTLTSGSHTTVGHEPQQIEFRIRAVKEFNQVPGFDPNDPTVVTMLLNEHHNVVYYNKHIYVDDRTLSCERGKRLTRKSCNLLYMCVKSNECSAGLITSVARTTVLEVGLHSCLRTEGTVDNDKLFRELKPVEFCHSEAGKPDMQGIVDTQAVATYFENGKKAAAYNGYTYVDRLTGCSHSVGCKCLYMCNKRPDCSAAILVDSRHAVLEVGLHSCQSVVAGCNSQSEPTNRAWVACLIPSTLINSLLDSFGYGAKTTLNGFIPRNAQQSSSQKLPDAGNSTVNEQVKKGKKRNGNDVNDVSSRNSKKRKKDIISDCEQIIMSNQVRKKLQEALFEEQISLAQNKTTPMKAHQLFMKITKQYKWSVSIIPVLDETDTLCVIYKGHVYSYTSHTTRSLPVESEWTCIQFNCLAVLHLDETKVSSTSRHYCGDGEQLPPSGNAPFQILHGEIKYLLYTGYVYQLSDLEALGRGISLNCIYRDRINCDGALALNHQGSIFLLPHSCRRTFEIQGNQHNDCAERVFYPLSLHQPINSTLKERVVEEIGLGEDNRVDVENSPLDTVKYVENMDDNITIKEEVLEEPEEVSPIESMINWTKQYNPDSAITSSNDVTIKEEVAEQTNIDNNSLLDVQYVDYMDDVTVKEEVLVEPEEVTPIESDDTYLKQQNTNDDITIKEEVIEEAPLEEDSRPLVFELRSFLPDLVPFDAPVVDNNRLNVHILPQVETNADEEVAATAGGQKVRTSSKTAVEKSLVSPYIVNSYCDGSNSGDSLNSNDFDFFEDVEDAIPISVVMARKK